MSAWWLGLADPPGDLRWLSQTPPRWWRTLGVLALWISFCTAAQLLALRLFPPLPAEGTPVLWAYGLYSGLVLLSGAIGLAWLAGLLAEAFEGRADLEAGLAATAVAFVPFGAAKLLRDWPGIGWLSWVLLLWGLLLLYRTLGTSQRLREGRGGHLFAVVIGALVIMLAVGWQLRDLIPGAAPAVRMGRLWLI